MKAILISIKPKWCAKIMNGNKTIEVRKNKALLSAIQKLIYKYGYVDVYAYCSKDKKYENLVNRGGFITGMVSFKFRCYKVEKIRSYLEPEQWYMTSDLGGSGLLRKSCLSFEALDDYLLSGDGYAIYISDLEIFDKPRELSEFETTKQQLVDIGQEQPILQNIRLTKAPQNFCYVETSE